MGSAAAYGTEVNDTVPLQGSGYVAVSGGLSSHPADNWAGAARGGAYLDGSEPHPGPSGHSSRDGTDEHLPVPNEACIGASESPQTNDTGLGASLELPFNNVDSEHNKRVGVDCPDTLTFRSVASSFREGCLWSG